MPSCCGLLVIIITIMAGEDGGPPAVSLLAALPKHLGDCDRSQRPASPSPGKSGISVFTDSRWLTCRRDEDLRAHLGVHAGHASVASLPGYPTWASLRHSRTPGKQGFRAGLGESASSMPDKLSYHLCVSDRAFFQQFHLHCSQSGLIKTDRVPLVSI